jgi:hypothetical protein
MTRREKGEDRRETRDKRRNDTAALQLLYLTSRLGVKELVLTFKF